jgi:hypothetical protein
LPSDKFLSSVSSNIKIVDTRNWGNDSRSFRLPSQITSAYNITFPGNSRATSVFSAHQARLVRAAMAQSVLLRATGSIPGRYKGFLSSLQLLDRLWGGGTSNFSPADTAVLYWGGGGVQGPETTLTRLVPRSRIMEICLHSPIRLHSEAIN